MKKNNKDKMKIKIKRNKIRMNNKLENYYK